MSSAGGLHRIVLVGFMAAGKTTVGRTLASSLGWEFHDMDQIVEAREGRSIGRIFTESGEPFFRDIEARVVEDYLDRQDVVLATGGGWAAVPENMAGLPDGTLTVWLKVTPAEAVRRAGSGTERPLLADARRLESATELLRQRASRYAAADLEVDTEGRTVEDVAAQILARVACLTANHST